MDPPASPLPPPATDDPATADVPAPPSAAPLPPPAPPSAPRSVVIVAGAIDPALLPVRQPRPGELTPSWRVALTIAWILVFLAYMGVWKASEEIGIATWWLGPRSNPQPIVVRLVPFLVTAVFGAISSFAVRGLPWISLGGSFALAGIAIPDFGRSVGLAVIEFTIAGAVALVSLASLTGRYRAVDPTVAIDQDVSGGPNTEGATDRVDAPAGSDAPAR